MAIAILLPNQGSVDPVLRRHPELDALPDHVGDRVAPTTDTQEAAGVTLRHI